MADFSNDSSIGGKGGSGVVIVRYSGRATQTISVASDKNPIIEQQTATLSASGFSGTGAISFAVASGSDVCAISGATLTAVKPGACTVTAAIAYDATYANATSSPLTITVVARTPQVISVNANPNPVNANKQATLSASGFPGTGAISYAVDTGADICSISGTKLTGRSPGTCTVTATIAQDATYAAATSAPLTVTVQPGLPEAPVMVGVAAGDRRATVTWDASTYDGGSAILEYNVYAWPDGKRRCVVGASTATRYECTVTGLRNGTTYDIRVEARNAVGVGPISDVVRAIPVGKPTAPINLGVSSKDGVLRLNWDRPEEDGGVPILQYWVEIKDPKGVWTTLEIRKGDDPRVIRVPNLSNGVEYSFRIRASNASGYGPFSDVVTGSVLVPRSTLNPLPKEVPPQTFMVIGPLDGGESYVKADRASIRVCHVADRKANVVAFLAPGLCRLSVLRDTFSVTGAIVDALKTYVVIGVDRPSRVRPMDLTEFEYADDRVADLGERGPALMKAFGTAWHPTRGTRESFGGPYVFCPPSAFTASGSLISWGSITATRCRLLSQDIAATVPQRGADYTVAASSKLVAGDSRQDRVIQAGMLPRYFPPSAPRDLEVTPDPYTADAAWDPPTSDGDDPNVTYEARVRVVGTEDWAPALVSGTTARIDFGTAATIPVMKDLEFQVRSVTRGGSSAWVSQGFRLTYAPAQVAIIPETVPPQSWVNLLVKRGRPAAVATSTTPQTCAVARGEALLFVGPGVCTVTIGQDNGRGGSTWLPRVTVNVVADSPLPGGVKELEIRRITFPLNGWKPDERSEKALAAITGDDPRAIHLYAPVAGSVPQGLVDQRWAAVRSALGVSGAADSYSSESQIAQSGLPVGDGNVIRIGVIPGSKGGGAAGASDGTTCDPIRGSAGSDEVLTFTKVGACEWTPPDGVTSVRVLVVGGGGGGGVNGRGGGGAGGMLEKRTFPVEPGSPVPVMVGAGGLGGFYGPNYGSWYDDQFVNTVSATNGGVSSFGPLSVLGGGFGSGCYSTGMLPAGNGGSGGGANGGCAAGIGAPGQGSDGSSAGGGGGAGGPGGPNGEGGPGRLSTITGSRERYAGGGGVGNFGQDSSTNAGGVGGGGNGAKYQGNQWAAPGVNGKGGGGGGGGWFPDFSRVPDWSNDMSIGGRGGSGVVIIRYANPD